MIQQLLQLLLILLIGNKNDPVNSLHKKQEPKPLGQFNWTVILLTLALTMFFVLVLISGIHGMSYVESGQLYNHMFR